RQNPERCQARRPAYRTAHDVRAGDQPQYRAGSRPDNPAVPVGAGRSGDRVMDRRAFITMVCGSILAAPLATEAEQARVYRIGVLGPTPIALSSDEGFRKGLGQFGYTDGQNLVIEYRDGEGTRLTELASDLVRLNVDIIYARGPAAVRAAQ